MIHRAFWTALACSLALGAAACSSDKGCQDLCELTDACPDVQPPEGTCEARCKAQEEFNKVALCENQQKDFDACVNNLPDVCDASLDCQVESLALFDCKDDYCKANPGATGCPE